MTGVEPGIDEWYLDREGRWDSGSGDDDPVDHGPDTWLDKLTGPTAKQGRATLKSVGRRLTSAWTKASNQSRRSSASATDRALARDAVLMNSRSGYTLSFADVVRRMQANGRKVTQADLKRAVRVTETPWGRPPKSSGAPTPQRTAPATRTAKPLATPKRPEPKLTSAQAVRKVLDASPKLPAAKVVQLLRAQGYRVSETDVLAMRLTSAEGDRARPTATKDSTRAPLSGPTIPPAPKPGDAALALAAIRINKAASRTLSYKEAVSQLQQSGWAISVEDLRRALRVTNSRWENTSKSPKTGPRSRSAHHGQQLLRAAPTINTTICGSCGVTVSADGHCGCS